MRRLEMSDAFALVLRKRRKAKGLSQELLAEKADLHPTYISLVERRLRNPSLNTAKALARGLNTPLALLIKEAEMVQRKAESG
jgi:transcriptional regulator with XRE-family HTH domain